jgi:glucose/arabinose dehydrogenase
MTMHWLALILLILSTSACGIFTSQPAAPAPIIQETTSSDTIVTNTPTSPGAFPEPTSLSGPSTNFTLPGPETVTWRSFMDGFNDPLLLTHAGDERLFIVEQDGLIWVIEDGQKVQEPFLDIRHLVSVEPNERGLLGLAFHPNYDETGRFFVNYTNLRGNTTISSFFTSSNRNKADTTSESILLEINQPFSNHNGGGIAFGPDSYLYIGTGDGGSAGDPNGFGQNLNVLLGKMLRLDIDSQQPYAIPADNPFIDKDGLGEIWAYGLRNPWRFSFDALTGDLYMGDVGQNAWEEVNFQSADSQGGLNYGWNIMEGSHAFSEGDQTGLTLPVAEYDHSRGCSITGGVVVRDSQLPGWEGVYLYGDYCSGQIWGLIRDEGGGWTNLSLYESGVRISSFGLDSSNRVYLVDHGGKIYRLDPQSP